MGPQASARAIFFRSLMFISTAQAHAAGTDWFEFSTTYECVFVHKVTAGANEMDVFF